MFIVPTAEARCGTVDGTEKLGSFSAIPVRKCDRIPLTILYTMWQSTLAQLARSKSCELIKLCDCACALQHFEQQVIVLNIILRVEFYTGLSGEYYSGMSERTSFSDFRRSTMHYVMLLKKSKLISLGFKILQSICAYEVRIPSVALED